MGVGLCLVLGGVLVALTASAHFEAKRLKGGENA